MYYLIQENLYKGFHEEKLITAIQRMGLEHEFFKQVPFVDELIFDTKRKDVFLFGSVKSSMIAQKYGFVPGSLFNDNHRYEVYSEYYKDNLLNYDSKIVRFEDVNENKLFFARPTEDTKTFTGRLFTNDEWKEFFDEKMSNGHNTSLTLDTPILISSPKTIFQEIRCFIINEKVVTASTYKMGSMIFYKECTDFDIIHFAESMAKLFSLNTGFVMDICRTESGLKIVECGCLNCAGFYDINIQKLLNTIENQFTIAGED